jgi:annexin A7/11
LTLGPLWLDVHLAKTAFQGVFTKDKMVLMELILGRSGDEIRLLNEGYRLKHGKTLVSDVEYYLSGKTERSKFLFFLTMHVGFETIFFKLVVFIMALNAQRPPDHLPVDDKQVAVDIENLYRASKKKDEVC